MFKRIKNKKLRVEAVNFVYMFAQFEVALVIGLFMQDVLLDTGLSSYWSELIASVCGAILGYWAVNVGEQKARFDREMEEQEKDEK